MKLNCWIPIHLIAHVRLRDGREGAVKGLAPVGSSDHLVHSDSQLNEDSTPQAQL